jgi:hypothetical protein
MKNRFHALNFANLLCFVLALCLYSCGNKASSNNETNDANNKVIEGQKPEQRFGTVLLGLTVAGSNVAYSLGHTLQPEKENESFRKSFGESGQSLRYFCSLNGSPFERCLAQGNIPSERLILGVNVFQAQLVIFGKESANPVYHEFVIGSQLGN